MRFLSAIFLCLAVLLMSCTMPVRTGYDRSIGGYRPAGAANSGAQAASNSGAASTASAGAAQAAKQGRPTTAGEQKNTASQKMAATNAPSQRKVSSLEALAKSWIGTKYVYGGTSRSGIDCSGYVMQLYKEYYGISLPHNAATIYKDSRGSSVSRGSLKEGDLVFFGSFWKIDHIGVYLSGDRFTHASTSKGVMISPMSDNYWMPKYQGARRFK